MRLKPAAYWMMTVHVFGASSSPKVANVGLKRTALDNADKYSPEVVNYILNNFYVDDGLIYVSSAQKAVDLVQESKALWAESGVRMHKFVSNSKKVIAAIPETDRATELQNIDLSKKDLPLDRALGVQ